MTFQCFHSNLILFTGGKRNLAECCEGLPWRALQVFAFEGSIQQGFSHTIHHCLSILSLSLCVCVCVCHRPLPLLVGILPSLLWGGDLFPLNRWELRLVLNLLDTLWDSLSHRALQFIRQRTTVSLHAWWVYMCDFKEHPRWDHAGSVDRAVTEKLDKLSCKRRGQRVITLKDLAARKPSFFFGSWWRPIKINKAKG